MKERLLIIFESANNHQGSVEHSLHGTDAMCTTATPFFDPFRFACMFHLFVTKQFFLFKDAFVPSSADSLRKTFFL